MQKENYTQEDLIRKRRINGLLILIALIIFGYYSQIDSKDEIKDNDVKVSTLEKWHLKLAADSIARVEQAKSDSLQRWYKTPEGKIYLREKLKEEFISKYISDRYGHVHCWEIEANIEQTLNDPGSYKHIKTNVSYYKDYCIVEVIFRARNGFNALIVSSQSAKIWYSGEIKWLD